MFIVKIINIGADFIAANAAVIVVMMSLVETAKRALSTVPWVKSWHITALGYIAGVLFAIPESGLITDYWLFVIHAFFLGLVATGTYKVGESLIRKGLSLK